MLKYAVLILWRKKGVAANFYAFCISDWFSNQGPYFTYVLKELRIIGAINVVFKTSTIHTILTCAKETAYNEVNQCNVVFKTSSGIRKKW